MDPMARLLAGLLPTIRYIDELACASSRDFVVIAGARGPVTAILGVEASGTGACAVGAMRRTDAVARLLGAGVPRETLAKIDAPPAAGEMLLVVATSERWGAMRFPRAQIAHIKPRTLDGQTATLIYEALHAAPRGAGGLAN